MTVQAPTSLCVPSWKSLTGPVKTTVVEPPSLDHFVCYPLTTVVGAYGFHVPAVVKVEDEFSTPSHDREGRDRQLPVRADVEVRGLDRLRAQSASDKSLMCFPVFTTPIKKTTWTKNQFGTGHRLPDPEGRGALPADGDLSTGHDRGAGVPRPGHAWQLSQK